jgi:hypothetical protein
LVSASFPLEIHTKVQPSVIIHGGALAVVKKVIGWKACQANQRVLLLACTEHHVRGVFEMLRRQGRAEGRLRQMLAIGFTPHAMLVKLLAVGMNWPMKFLATPIFGAPQEFVKADQNFRDQGVSEGWVCSMFDKQRTDGNSRLAWVSRVPTRNQRGGEDIDPMGAGQGGPWI